MNNHTCGYKIEFDNEISVGDKTYYVDAEVSVEFDGEVDVQSMEVTRCIISPEEGDNLPWTTEGGSMEKIVVAGNLALTEAIEKALDKEIQTFAEDNCRFIGMDVAEDYEACRAEWHRE